MNKLLWAFFWISCIVIVGMVATRLWAMHLLADGEIRQRVQTALETVAKHEGWFVSDISIRSVGMDDIRIMYRPHVRGRDPKTCYSIPLQTLELLPCGS